MMKMVTFKEQQKIFFLWGFLALITGVLYYLLIRRSSPVFLDGFVGVNNPYYIKNSLVLTWLPSFLHAFGFTCLLSFSLRVSLASVFYSGIFWFAVNLGWECNQLLLGVSDFISTPDMNDIYASFIGAVSPFVFYVLTTKIIYNEKTTS